MIAMYSHTRWCRIFLVALIAIASVSLPAAGARYCKGTITCRQCHAPPSDRRCWQPRAAPRVPPRDVRKYQRPRDQPLPTSALVYRPPAADLDPAPLLAFVCCTLAFAVGVAVTFALTSRNAADATTAKRSTVTTRVVIAKLEVRGPQPQRRP